MNQWLRRWAALALALASAAALSQTQTPAFRGASQGSNSPTFRAGSSASYSGIVFRGAASAATTAATLSVNKPAATVSGDLMIASIAVRSAAVTITPPSGWTLVRRTDNSPEASLSVYYKIATASEPSSYTFATSTGMSAAAWIAAYSGVNQTTPVDTDKGQFVVTSSTTYNAPGITTTYANDVVLFTIGAFDQGTSGDTWTGPTTQRKQINNNNAKSIVFGDVTQAAPGASAATSATASFSQDYALLEQLALRCQ